MLAVSIVVTVSDVDAGVDIVMTPFRTFVRQTDKRTCRTTGKKLTM